MKKLVSIAISISILCIMIIAAYGLKPLSSADRASLITIPEWYVAWGDALTSLKDAQKSPPGAWIKVAEHDDLPPKPPNVSSAWMKITLPKFDSDRYGIYIPELFAQNLVVYIGDENVHEVHQKHSHDIKQLMLPLNREDAGKTVYVKVDTTTKRIGIISPIWIGEYGKLLSMFVRRDLESVVIGFALIFIALVMFICSFFLKRGQLPSWISLCIVIFTLGVMCVTYSTFSYTFYGEYGQVYVDLYDLSIDIFLPAMTYVFERMIGDSKRRILHKFRKFQTVYSVCCIIFMIVNHVSGYRFAKLYSVATVTMIGYIMLVQITLLVIFTVLFALRKNKDAIIFASGVLLFMLMGLADLILYYKSNQTYQFLLWKWGIVCFVISLIVILGRKFAINHDLIIKYSMEAELFNQQIQNSEKMEMISALAASVAHEVRNPLQVTRGFLQLTAEKADDKSKYYMKLAIDELDRASGIITDFLTFAKPQMDEISRLNILNELKQIEVITVPMASMHGGDIIINVPHGLYIQGNSSKLKQALINLIKNSIEALRGQGQIHIWAYKQSSEIVIKIQDNGEGIDPDILDKLGKPYLTTKTKGTGLGLMVTFRIIELMKGKLEFKSQKGEGTIAIIRFPAAAE